MAAGRVSRHEAALLLSMARAPDSGVVHNTSDSAAAEQGGTQDDAHSERPDASTVARAPHGAHGLPMPFVLPPNLPRPRAGKVEAPWLLPPPPPPPRLPPSQVQLTQPRPEERAPGPAALTLV